MNQTDAIKAWLRSPAGIGVAMVAGCQPTKAKDVTEALADALLPERTSVQGLANEFVSQVKERFFDRWLRREKVDMDTLPGWLHAWCTLWLSTAYRGDVNEASIASGLVLGMRVEVEIESPTTVSDDRLKVLAETAGGHSIGAAATRAEERMMAAELLAWRRLGLRIGGR